MKSLPTNNEANPPRRAAWLWALYDWGNSAFATSVVAGFFPLFFKRYWYTGGEAVESTFWLGLVSSLAGLLVALVTPLLAVHADVSTRKKQMLFVFTCLGAGATMSLPFVPAGAWPLAAGIYLIAGLGFGAAIVFYDSLLPVVASADRHPSVSSLGYALGYLGGGLLFAVHVMMYLHPASFGLSDGAQAIKAAFFTVGIWWIVFTLPLLFYVCEPSSKDERSMKEGLISNALALWSTVREVCAQRSIWMFLIAYWLYIDGVYTVIKMAVDYGAALGFESSALIAALLLTQFVGFPATLLWGYAARRWGVTTMLQYGIAGYIVVSLWGAAMTSEREFYILAACVGLLQGGVQALSRAFFSPLVPTRKAAQYFTLFHLVGRFAAVVGPLLIGATAVIFDSSRAGISSVVVLFVLGLLFLRAAGREAPGRLK